MAQDAILNRWNVNGDIYEIQDAGRGHPLGVATLDENGRVPYEQLPESAVEFKGYWNADTNTPTLHDGVGTKGDMYYVDVAGTQDLGSGSQFFNVGDRVLYDGSVWKNMSADVTDAVTDGDMRPVTSNAVYDALSTEIAQIEQYFDNGINTIKNNGLSYNTTETLTGGKWIDGKPIYRKVVDCGALTNNTPKNVAHNIQNISFVVNYYAISANGTDWMSLPASWGSALVGISVDLTNIIIRPYSDRRSYTTTYAIIEYTKTTD